MKVLIVDDVRLAREEMRRLLRDFPDVEIAGEAANATEARQLIRTEDPDLLLLDIQMPGEDGFELLQSLDSAPDVIFITAYDEYAVRAFDENALDYLMKPVQKERLGKALEKVRQQISRHQQGNGEPVHSERRLGPTDKFFVRDGERCWFITLKDVHYIETMGNFSRIRFGDEKAVTPKPLSALENRLDPAIFIRANRQVIINLEYVQKVEPWFNGGLRVFFPGDVTFDISRRQATRLKELLSL